MTNNVVNHHRMRAKRQETSVAMKDQMQTTKPEEKVIRGTKLPPRLYDPNSRPDLIRKPS